MSIIRAFTGALGGTFADQWKDIITAGYFDEHTVVSPGVFKQSNKNNGSDFVISNGSKILVPENTAAFIFSQSGIEEFITSPGGYEYQNGEKSVFNKDGFNASIFKQVIDRVGYGGQASELKQIAFVNLREIRGLKFGTRGPLVYNDIYYETDLEVLAFGTFSVQVTNPKKFIENFLPANINYYSFDTQQARAQIISEFLQSFTVALNSLSTKYRISLLPSKSNEISEVIASDSSNAGTWNERFGIEIIKVGIENIEFSPESRDLVKQYSSNKMNIKAYENQTQKSSNIAAQQKIAQGIQDNGFGDGAGMFFGMNISQALGTKAEMKESLSFNEQIDAVVMLKDLLDSGILSQEEFDFKKKEIMGL